MKKLEILNAKDKGDPENERLVLKALDDMNTGGYAVVDITFDEEGDVSNLGKHAYRFPSKDIKKGDYVILYTRAKKGNSVTEKMGDDNKTNNHFFFWGREKTVWNIDGDHATLFYVVDSKAV